MTDEKRKSKLPLPPLPGSPLEVLKELNPIEDVVDIITTAKEKIDDITRKLDGR